MNSIASPRLRPILGYVTVLGILPYLSLKLAWTAGSEVGVTTPGLLHSAEMRAANGFTAVLDLVAVVLALALTHRWGLRLPAWPMLVPLWVGTGLLLPIALGAPAIAAQFAGSGAGGMGLAAWVTPLVYTSFVWQGVALLTAFVLYARARWTVVFAGTGTGGVGVAGGAGAVLAVLVAVGTVARLADGEAPRVGTLGIEAVEVVLALGAVAGIVALRRPGRRLRGPVLLLWAGSAVLAAQAFWAGVSAVLGVPLDRVGWFLVAAGGCGGLLLAVALLAQVGATTRAGRAVRGSLAPHAP
ncbi:hypothetical protein [Saccharomonospora piscinae]|uniref:hypothetical protein n=1 Tax=Saccharomonospora piscinae TaxID=687388 RepID=UPI000463AE7A|nr:hypothetical protein [Saccharomonospora piscinae]